MSLVVSHSVSEWTSPDPFSRFGTSRIEGNSRTMKWNDSHQWLITDFSIVGERGWQLDTNVLTSENSLRTDGDHPIYRVEFRGVEREVVSVIGDTPVLTIGTAKGITDDWGVPIPGKKNWREGPLVIVTPGPVSSTKYARKSYLLFYWLTIIFTPA